MAQINVSNLTFGYEGSYDNIFENVSFSIDTNWKLGFIGRNGKGKTTFLNLLLGKYEYQGSITKTAVFDYFPYRVNDAKDLDKTADELMEKWKPQVENWRVLCELGQLEIDAELLYRPFGTLSFGERVFLKGKNGCGKSSLIKYILKRNAMQNNASGTTKMITTGTFSTAPNLIISYIDQDTSHLSGKLKDYADRHNIDYTMLLSILRSLDMERVQFEKNIEEFSEGQKKKVLIAASLLTPAHIYIWDEPLNYIDVFSRMQIETLIERFKPTMLVVEHDVRFMEKLATRVVEL